MEGGTGDLEDSGNVLFLNLDTGDTGVHFVKICQDIHS